jgi:hypothetical protein
MERLQLYLDSAEYAALARLAEQDLRPIPNEARHLVREALVEVGLLQAPVGTNTVGTEEAAP